jgi:flagellar biosynthesis protein FlhF
MSQVLRQVKAALGDEAVILDTTEASGTLTVTAAVDDGEVEAGLSHAGGRADGELLLEVRQLLGVVGELVDEHWRRRVPGLGPDLVRLQRALTAQGVEGMIAAALVKDTAERLCPGVSLGTALARTLDPLTPSDTGARVRLLMGPAGDGKTTTVVKLAAREQQGGRRVAIIGTDTYRVGANSELETYGRVLGVPVYTAAHPSELERALKAARDADLVLIDTAGAAGRAELVELNAIAEAVGPEAGRTLVLSAATAGAVAGQMWQAFASLRPDACVLTKLDVAPGGPVLGLCWRRGVPVSHVAAGRRIPGDLETATPERLAGCLLAA